MDQLTNKDYDEIKMQLDVLAGIIADLDEPNDHVFEVAGAILGKVSAADDSGDLSRFTNAAFAALDRLTGGQAPFDTGYPALCDSVDRLQRAVEQLSNQETLDQATVSDPDDDLSPAPDFLPDDESLLLDDADFSLAPDLPELDAGDSAELSAEDAGELEMNLDIICDLLADMDPDNTHLKSVLVDMFQKISSIAGLPAYLMHDACTSAALLQAGRTDFSEGVARLRVIVDQLRDIVSGEHAAMPATAADAARAASGISSSDLDTFLELHPPMLEALEQDVLNIEHGGAAALNQVRTRIHSLIEEYDKYEFPVPGTFLKRLAKILDRARGALAPDAITALLNARDILFDAFDTADGEELDQDRARETLASLDAAIKQPESQVPAAQGISKPIARTAKPERQLPEIALNPDNPELSEFVSESMEYLQSAEVALLELEKNPSSFDHINEIFRCFHNIKGISGFMSLNDVQQLSHIAESLMDQAREGKIAFSGPVANVAFDALDMLRTMAERVEAAINGSPYQIPDGYLELLDRLENPWDTAAQKTPGTRAADPEPGSADDAGAAAAPAGERMSAGAITSRRARTNGAIKVSTSRLDHLIDSVGELVISNSMVMQEPEIRDTDNPRLARNMTQLAKITRELQELAMSMRMVSLKSTFQKMARLARDLSVKSRVPVEFTYSGEDTELDRNVVEEIGSPLVHMVRNAVDHGIEKPDERKAAGKPPKGKVRLRAFHEGGSVIIKLEDDGGGLNRDKILAKAESLNLIAPGAGADMGDREVFGLIFHPGFSTADQVTDVSGRGVGMDVVKRSIENLRGRMEIDSAPGQGTTFTIRLPLTLAIIDGMVVTVGGERYIVPTIAIIESLRPAPGQLKSVVGRGEMLNLRGELLPLFRLYKLFHCENARTDPANALVVVIAGDGGSCALLVDELVGQQQVVIKSLGRAFDELEGVSGGAIMGDGRVALIIDAAGLVRAARAMA